MRTNIFVIGVEVGVVESYGGGKRVKDRRIRRGTSSAGKGAHLVLKIINKTSFSVLCVET